MTGSTTARPGIALGGHIDGVAYYLAFTIRDRKVRPISLRRAHAKEMKRHVPQDEI
jgi:uncharacterized DUF497 family protein